MDEVTKKRIRWQCRRGLLELDAMLLPFYENIFERLSHEEQAAFSKLLSHSDPELLSWLVGEASCPDPALQPLVQRIQVGK